MKNSTLTIVLAATLAAAPVSLAQQAPGARAPAAAATVSDADLETFASIYVDLLETAAKFEAQMQAAQSEEQALAVRERVQAESLEKVARRGWTPDKFNSVSEAINSDPALADRAVKLIEQR